MIFKNLFGHKCDPESTVEVTSGDLKEPDDPQSRKVKIRIKKTTCKICGRLLALQPAGIIFDPKYDRESYYES